MDKRGPKSDEAYARQVLGSMANSRNILVINDEAHHAWRKNPELKYKYVNLDKKEEQEATVWVGGLDRIHKARNILTCYDFSATPFAPSGKKNESEALFSWIVSDFGLNDGIESGLVKTPRMVVRDDNAPDVRTFRSKLNHIYADETVRDNINQAAEPSVALPDLVIQAYNLLGSDWLAIYKEWKEKGVDVPPVMITVANRTETAARVEHAFKSKKILIKELCDPECLLRIDSKILEQLDSFNMKNTNHEPHEQTRTEEEKSNDRGLSLKEQAEMLRETVNTVGQKGELGGQIRNLISVGMLTEGWDAKTVTHIMGLRAFSSQLLCEQVVGRGLRRTSYEVGGNGLYKPEYVNIFGIPFSFLPQEGGGEEGPPPQPKYAVQVNYKAAQYEISWPNIIRINHEPDPRLHVDFSQIEPLILDAGQTRLSADLAPFIDGKPDLAKCSPVDLANLEKRLRMQEILFKTSASVYETMPSNWKDKGTPYALLGQVFRLVERYIESGKIILLPEIFIKNDPLKRKILYMLNMNLIVQHLWKFIECKMSTRVMPMFNPVCKVRSTGNMPTWWTVKRREPLSKSHISHAVYDSAWEATEAYKLEKNPRVTAFAKNDHLGFGILYTFGGVNRIYYPDFLVKLDNGRTLVLETKGEDSRQTRAKQAALAEWVDAVNSLKEYGQWRSDISFNVADVDGIIAKYL
ncbi:MAG: hypothetical protein LBU82_01495 [Treponema sp.]|nr:hypothetical protein [Treponema sp.]